MDSYIRTVLEGVDQADLALQVAYTGSLVAAGCIVVVKGNHQDPEVDT